MADDPGAFAWNENAINVYVTNACNGGVAPAAPRNPIVIGQSTTGADVRWLHEFGHFFSLAHTHGPARGCEDEEDPDCLEDTPVDQDDWDTADLISQGNFSMDYDHPGLTCEQRGEVLDVLYNIMSYNQDDHNNIVCDPLLNDVSCTDIPPPNLCRHRLTTDQLDLITDVSNTLRRNVSTGCMIFVDSYANAEDLLGVHACDAAAGFCGSSNVDVCCDLDDDGLVDEPCAGSAPWPRPDLDGNSARPYPTVAGALEKASQSDVLLVRGGYYDENLIIQDNVTLRAAEGNAVIGGS